MAAPFRVNFITPLGPLGAFVCVTHGFALRMKGGSSQLTAGDLKAAADDIVINQARGAFAELGVRQSSHEAEKTACHPFRVRLGLRVSRKLHFF